MTVNTAAGTTLAISAATPATYDQAGYEASAVSSSWAVIGEITGLPAHGRTYTSVEHLPLSSRTVQIFKGSRREGTLDIPLGRDSDDAGQLLAKTALDSDNDYSFRVLYPGGDAEYFRGKVMAMPNAAENADSIVTRTISIAITGTAAGVGIVEVLAP